MRLSEQEVSGIITALEKFNFTHEVELRLYGSRANDKKKGGDIDLLLIFSNPERKNEAKENKHRILNQIKENIGDQKIDLFICEKSEIEADPFLKLIFPDSVILKKW